jgi:hypothetical protein
MSTRVTQALLAIIALLLLAHLLRPVGVLPVPSAHAATGVDEVVRAKLIELVAANGQVVAQLHAGDDGGGQLRLRSATGAVRVKLGATSDGSGLILMDSEADPAVWVTTRRAGTSLTLAQKGKDKRVLAP